VAYGPESLVQRKRTPKRLIPKKSTQLLYVDHVEERGEELFEAACRNDLEGIVAKLKSGTYTSDRRLTTWVKIKNPAYRQAQGREELFEALQGGSRNTRRGRPLAGRRPKPAMRVSWTSS